MKGETGYLLPDGCVHAPKAYEWNCGGLLLLFFIDKYLETSLFLPVLAVLLLNVLSRVYCNNYKLNFIIIKENKQEF